MTEMDRVRGPGISEQYLLDYLTEEFRDYSEVRIRRHRVREGDEEMPSEVILLTTASREYIFYPRWVETRQMREVERLVRQIKEVLGAV